MSNSAPSQSFWSELRFHARRYKLIHGTAHLLRLAFESFARGIFHLLRRLPYPLSFGLASGSYSELELLTAKPPKLQGRIILLDQGTIPAAPDSLLERCGRIQHKQQPWPVFWTHHPEAELVGSSLVQVDGRGRLCQEAVYYRYGKDDPSLFFPRLLSKPTRLRGNWTSIVSRWMPISKPHAYGHWILEMLPRLALLPEFPADTKILVPPFRPAYQEESLRMLGLLDRCRWTSEQHLVVEDYYFSAPPSMIACYNPYAIGWVRDAYLPLVAADTRETPRRFFVRRRGRERNIVNEAEVHDFFRALGWEIVDAAELSFADQIRYFSRAEAVCGIHGSGFTNVLWCPPGVKLLELFADVFLASDAEWISTCIPGAVHRHLIFRSDVYFNAIIDLNRVREGLRRLDLL